MVLPEAENAVAGNHGGARKGAMALRVDVTERGEDVIHVRPGLVQLTQGVSEDVESVSGWSQSAIPVTDEVLAILTGAPNPTQS